MTSQNYDGLDEAQKIFIRNKVQQLGSIIAVNKFYHGDCSIDKYAHYIADEIYSNRPNNLYTKHKETKVEEVKPKVKDELDNKQRGVRENIEVYHCIDCGDVIPPKRALAIKMIALRCEECQSLIARNERKEQQNRGTRKYIDEGLAGTREGHKRMRGQLRNEMSKRSQGHDY